MPECDTNNGGCKQNCHNVDGSFACSCNPGYTLKSDGFGCDGKIQTQNHQIPSSSFTFIIILLIADINECSKGTHGCSNGCTNTVGSYLCYCPTGYELDASLKTCVGKKDDDGYTVYKTNDF